MRCERAREAVSASADADLVDADAVRLDRHLSSCAACRSFAGRIERIRHHLRFEAVDEVPDVAPIVLASLRGQGRDRAPARSSRRVPISPPRLARIAAAFLAGLLVGALLARGSLDGPDVAVAAGLPDRVVAAQADLDALSTSFSLVERGWHPDVPERRFRATLRYRSPESLHLHLRDETQYPSNAWVRNDVALVVNEDEWWTSGPRNCPVEAQPTCTPETPRTRVVEGREPFADATPIPLDLVVPVRSFTLSAPPEVIGDRVVDGRETVGVAVTAAQAAPLLDALRPAGNLRDFHPADRVELWLERETLVPLAFRVIAAGGSDRSRWAASRGYVDEPGTAVLEVEATSVAINRPDRAEALPDPPDGATRANAGFRPGPADATPTPRDLPPGFVPYRSGSVVTAGGPRVDVRSWTDGRAWLTVRSTRGWAGNRLFGDLGPLVRPVALGDGIGYLSEDGSRLGIHAEAVDLVLSGTIPEQTLVAAAASLDVTSLSIPPDWAEAGTGTFADARRALDRLLTPRELEGFGDPAVRVRDGEVTMAFAGPGSRGFLLIQTPGSALTPPLEPDVRELRVRDVPGRFSPSRGEIEWVETNTTISITSATLTAEELLAIARSLEASP